MVMLIVGTCGLLAANLALVAHEPGLPVVSHALPEYSLQPSERG